MRDKYSEFDERGIPTHDMKGKELSKEIRTKLNKEYMKQDKVYNDWRKKEETKVIEETKKID